MTPLPQDANGAVGYVNTNRDDPAFGVPVYQDGYGNLFYTQPGAEGRSETRVMLGKMSSLPSYVSQAQPSAQNAPLTGATAAQVINGAAPAAAATSGPTQTGTSPSPAPAGQQQTLPNVPTATDQQFEQWLNSQNLSPDQKQAIKSIYDAVATNDQAKADQMLAAMDAASKYSEPYFKAQISLVTDALQRGLSAVEGDLSFKENQLKNSLADLQKNLASSKEFLTLEQAQELKQLESMYTQQLDQTQSDMASRGFSSSSIRSRAEKILGDNYTGMVESSNRKLGYQLGNIGSQLSSAERDTQAQLAYYQQLAQQNKLNQLRAAEASLGTANLTQAGYGQDALGGIGGEIPRAQGQDQLQFAQGFVF